MVGKERLVLGVAAVIAFGFVIVLSNFLKPAIMDLQQLAMPTSTSIPERTSIPEHTSVSVSTSVPPVNSKIAFNELAHSTTTPRPEDTTTTTAGRLGLRIACWILTNAEHHRTQGLAVKNTWGSRCDKLVFISSKKSKILGAIKADVPDGREYLWGKTKAGLRYVYENYLNDTDWFLKADGDSYVITENLRSMLAARSPRDLLYFGYRLKPAAKQRYLSGDSVYVLSRAALTLVVEQGLGNATKCEASDEGSADDMLMGQCLENLGIAAGDSRDGFGRDRFFPWPPNYPMNTDEADKAPWLWKYAYYKITTGLECCSDSAVAFQHIDYRDMYVYEYLIYYLRVHHKGSLVQGIELSDALIGTPSTSAYTLTSGFTPAIHYLIKVPYVTLLICHYSFVTL